MATDLQPWRVHAARTVSAAGHRSSAARDEVIAAMERLGCSMTAREIGDDLRANESAVGLASIYRALELLERLELIQRFELGEGTARYEPVHPDRDHHHHIVCDSCGRVDPFEDDALEVAIARLSDRSGFSVATHDVTLRGECPSCRTDAVRSA